MNSSLLRPRFLILLFIFLSWVGPSSASDTAKEKRWEEQIVPALLIGEAVKLKAGSTEFLGLYTPASGKKIHGGVILLHGTGVHPAWPEIIEPLREQLPQHGWAVLSLQMPILANDAKLEDYAALLPEAAPRIDAAVAFLKQKGQSNLVLAGHSMGATMALAYLANKPDPSIHALVGVGIEIHHVPQLDNAIALAKLHLPILDIYGGMDSREVLDTEQARRDAATKAGNKNYTQVKVAGADHFFVAMNDELVKRVRSWLEKNTTGK